MTPETSPGHRLSRPLREAVRAAAALLVLSSACGGELPGRVGPGGPEARPPAPPASVASPNPATQSIATRGLSAECGVQHQPCRDAFFSAVIALPDGTMMASTEERHGHLGPVEIRRPDGTECAAPVRCTSFLSQGSRAVWCIHASQHVGPAELGYSLDSGMSWHVAELPPDLLYPDIVIPARDGEGLLLAENFHGRVWSVKRATPGSDLRIENIGERAPGEGGPSVAFFGSTSSCLGRYGLDGTHEAKLLCRERAASPWHSFGPTSFIDSASGPRTWWGLDLDGRLFRSAMKPAQWERVDAAGFDFRELSQQGGEGGGLFAVATRNGAAYVLRMDDAGKIADQIPIGLLRLIRIGAGGGRLAVAALEGCFVLEGNTLVRALAACDRHPP